MTPSTPRQIEAEITTAFERLGVTLRGLQPEPAVTARTEPTAMVAAAAPASPAPAQGTATTDVVEDLLAAARRKAAVLGWFKPGNLVPLTDRRLRQRVLSGLVVQSEVRPEDGVWRLDMAPRREELAALAKDSQAAARALRETRAETMDPESHLLRRVVQGKPLRTARIPGAHTASVRQVAEWTDGIFANAPRPAEVRGLQARQALKESLGVLLHRFRGRESELKALHRFVAHAPATLATLPILAVSGIGGVGKSTLLARFTQGLLERPERSRPAVVLIDFDRPRFASGDPVALTFELTRQVAAWFPAIAEPLRQLRHDVRKNLLSADLASRSQMETFGHEAVARSTSEMSHMLRGILDRAKVGVAGGRPLVVILDTFEVLQGSRAERSDGVPQASGHAGFRGVDAVAEWADDLFSRSGLRGLKLLVAGRAPIAEDPTFGPQLTQPEIVLRGLDHPSATALLRDHGLSATDAALVMEAVSDPADGSGNPLILRLAARLVKAGTVRPAALRKARLGEGKALDQELVQGVLYRRILDHIGDTEKNKALAVLAHPGLVLRRVTPHLIEKVLIPLTDLRTCKGIDPRALFERLRREIWLVRESGPDTVTHRTDLRRTMLRLIDADTRGQARRIHRAAARYYLRGQDPHLSPELAAGEAFYHRLMLMDRKQSARLDPAEVRRFESALSLTLEDLPPPVLAVVKSILDRPLTDGDGRHLPEPRRTEFILRQGERHVRNDEPYRALRLLEAKPDLHPLWELRGLAGTASWPQARLRGLLKPSVPSAPWTAPDSAELHERVNLATWVWFGLGRSRSAFESASKLLTRYEGRITLPQLPSELLEPVARCLTYRTIAARDGGLKVLPKQGVPWGKLSLEYLGGPGMALEANRHAILSVGERGRHMPDHPVVFSGEALPPSISRLEALASDAPAEVRDQLHALHRRLQRLPRSATSGLILGILARGFPKAVPVEASFWNESRFPSLPCPNPEFRGPVKWALLETFTTPQELGAVAEAAWALLDLRPQDLRPDAFARSVRRPGRAGPEVVNLVLYLDRSTVLGQFLRAVQKMKPKEPRLAMVNDAFQRWERAFWWGAGPSPSKETARSTGRPSARGTWSRHPDSNRGPADYESRKRGRVRA